MGDQQRSELKASGLGMNWVGAGKSLGMPKPQPLAQRGVTWRALDSQGPRWPVCGSGLFTQPRSRV